MCPLVFEHSIYKHTTVKSLFIEADLYQAITLHGESLDKVLSFP